jgi:hypothetical protein
MQTTQHFQHRMSQRGVNKDMVELVLEYGTLDQDKYVLGRREATGLLELINRQARVVKKILDKGGVTVVAEDGALITTYNCTGRTR